MDQHDEDDPDWEGVSFHTHEDGTRHVTVNIEMTRNRPPWWKSGRMWRLFRRELILISVYAIVISIGTVLWGFHPLNLLTAVAMMILLVSIIVRAITSYRVGFAMGIAAVPIAMQQKSPKVAAELLDRSSELWDPSPLSVAHTMEIERLERDVNRGK